MLSFSFIHLTSFKFYDIIKEKGVNIKYTGYAEHI